ncbi:MAG: Hemerythrin domain protein [Candidatus Rifleibacterium amylolyticum]|nr:MAG: Hemerythrin domain protein [Candidatus Rifleibacterium amylolyticum]
MSELINNSENRKKKLKELILKLHDGQSQESVREELLKSLSNVPYEEVVEVEQELIKEGLAETEILKLCDAHSAVLHGNIDLSKARKIPAGHPVDVMLKENGELKKLTASIRQLLEEIKNSGDKNLDQNILKLRGFFNNLYDVDKHYLRKEYLLFPYLEKFGISGPPKVMWGKHDEIRGQIKGAIELLKTDGIAAEELLASAEIVLVPAVNGVVDMTTKEEEILLPMSLDKLSDDDWYEIDRQSLEIGFCLYDPPQSWKPAGAPDDTLAEMNKSGGNIQLPSGSFSVEELLAILNSLPVDMTFVDRNDKVKYFSQAKERIFQRNRAILNRDVRLCHPPASAHIVDKIIDDFRSGRKSRAPFWINMGGKMIHIEYFALRNEKGEYLGTLEVSHNVQPYRDLEGEQRILSYKE